MLTDREKELIRLMQGDMVVSKRPFAVLAERIEGTEDDVLDMITQMQQGGVIRKLGAILRHRNAGVTENALVIWAVPEEACLRVGTLLASYREITHCYERIPPLDGKYTIYTMIHRSEGDIEQFVRDISLSVGIADFQMLTSEEEFKKSSMEYY
jgi:DNA-binding Lrp family transcriptional regulator